MNNLRESLHFAKDFYKPTKSILVNLAFVFIFLSHSYASANSCMGYLASYELSTQTWDSYLQYVNTMLSSGDFILEKFNLTNPIFRHNRLDYGYNIEFLLNGSISINKNTQIIFNNYMQLLRTQIRRHNTLFPHNKISIDDDALKPGVLFVKKDTKVFNTEQDWLVLELNQPIPDGYIPFELSGIKSFPPGELLYGSLAKGFFPVLLIEPRAATHDLFGHLSQYPNNLVYTKSYRKIAKRIYDQVIQNRLNKIKNPWSFLYQTGLFARVYTFNESLVGVDRNILYELYHEALGVSRETLKSDSLVQFSDVSIDPNTTDPQKLIEIFNELSLIANKTMIAMGGATLVGTVNDLYRNRSHNFLLFLIKLGEEHARYQNNLYKPNLSLIIALIRGFLINVSKTNVEEIYQQMFKSKPDVYSPYIYFWSKESGFMDAYLNIKFKQIKQNLEELPHSRYGLEHWNTPLPSSFNKAR